MTSHSERKPRVDGRVTEENIKRWAASKESGRLGQLSNMLLDVRMSFMDAEANYFQMKAIATLSDKEARGYRRWWFMWPLIKRLR